jgi:hypothetical protein
MEEGALVSQYEERMVPIPVSAKLANSIGRKKGNEIKKISTNALCYNTKFYNYNTRTPTCFDPFL